MAAKGKSNGKVSIIIRKEEVVEGGHHGGAWKVAYADFVTAMMAFFLLMWLLNATTSEQRRGLADYFSPSNQMSRVTSGFGSIFGGHTPNDDGSLASDRGSVQVMNQDAKPTFDIEDDDSDVAAQAASYGAGGADVDTRRAQRPGGPVNTDHGKAGAGTPGMGAREAALASSGAPGSAAAAAPARLQEPRLPQERGAEQRQAQGNAAAEQAKAERLQFQQAAQQIKALIAADPALAGLAHQLAVDLTPEGLRIQILDEDKQAMFATGSAVPNERARALLLKVAPVLMKLPEQISITGHTDAAPYKGNDRSNWELSADRANATRRLLAEAGLPESRIQTVAGQADRDLLLPADPLAAANRRIAIVVLRSAGKKGG